MSNLQQLDETLNYLNEALKTYNPGDNIEINFNNVNYNVKISNSGKLTPEENRLFSKIDSCVKYLNSIDLWNYLYKYHKSYFEDINDDPYFDGKKINSGADLKKSINDIKGIYVKYNSIYIAGEYWCDEEHGFSICFPGGKFVKSKFDKYDYNRDQGKDAKYIPQVTLLGQYGDVY